MWCESQLDNYPIKSQCVNNKPLQFHTNTSGLNVLTGADLHPNLKQQSNKSVDNRKCKGFEDI